MRSASLSDSLVRVCELDPAEDRHKQRCQELRVVDGTTVAGQNLGTGPDVVLPRITRR